MKKKIITSIVVLTVLIILIFFCFYYAKIKNLVSKSIYIGKEYCYTCSNIDNNVHHNKRYYYFYDDKDNNRFICIKNNGKIFYINDFEELEKIYQNEIMNIIADKRNERETYDKEDNKITSEILKNLIFPKDNNL